MEAFTNPEKFVVPIGPQHPALKEPAHFEFTVDGEIVTAANIRLGFVHRGIEKGAEDRNWTQNLYLVERVCGICSHVHAMALAIGVEQLAGVTIPKRAQAIRTLVAELERVHSHMLWLGVAAHEGGFDTLFMYSWRDRETVMDLLEGLTGNRVHYSVNVIGGVKVEVTPQQADAIRKGVDFLEERAHHYMKVVTTDETFLGRTRDVGTMTKEQALLFGAVGPTARASGAELDIRRAAPYAAYQDFPVNVVTGTQGDLKERFIVRIKELYETFRLIREILERMPAGDLFVKVPRKVKAGETISRVEAPRGELLYFIKSAGGEKPERLKIRTPSLCNWASVMQVAVGHKLADMPMMLAGIDPCFSCNDRVFSVRRKRAGEDQNQVWTWEDLRQYGIRYYQK